jgi:large subunit ribosomal protein L32
MSKVKHRHSRERGRKRRTHYKAGEVTLAKCDQCGKMKKAHQVCSYCGYFKGRQVKAVEDLEARKAKREKKGGQI